MYVYASLWFALCAFDIFSEYLLFPIRIFVVRANTLHAYRWIEIDLIRFFFFQFLDEHGNVLSPTLLLFSYSLRISVRRYMHLWRLAYLHAKSIFFFFFWNVTITVFRTRIWNRRCHQYVFSIFRKKKKTVFFNRYLHTK